MPKFFLKKSTLVLISDLHVCLLDIMRRNSIIVCQMILLYILAIANSQKSCRLTENHEKPTKA